MKKINLKKVNKNTLCNVLIVANAGILIFNIINKKKKKKVATQKDIDNVCDYIVDVYDYIDERIERNHIDSFRYVDSKLDEKMDEIDDKIEKSSKDTLRYVDNKLDSPRLKPNPHITDTAAPIIFDQKTCTTTGSEPVHVRDTDFK